MHSDGKLSETDEKRFGAKLALLHKKYKKSSPGGVDDAALTGNSIPERGSLHSSPCCLCTSLEQKARENRNALLTLVSYSLMTYRIKKNTDAQKVLMLPHHYIR